MDNLEDIFIKSQCPVRNTMRQFVTDERHKLSHFSSPVYNKTLATFTDLFNIIRENYLYYDYFTLKSFVDMSKCEKAMELMKQYVEDINDIPIHNLPPRCQMKHSYENKLEIVCERTQITAEGHAFLIKTFNKCFSLPKDCVILRKIESVGAVLVYEISPKVKDYILSLKNITKHQMKPLTDLKMGINSFRVDDEMELKVSLNYDTKVIA